MHNKSSVKMHVMGQRFIEIFVEADDEIPQDCVQRFQAIGEPRRVIRIRYEPDDGPMGIFRVFGRGGTREAFAVDVDDSGEGTSTLIFSEGAGLRLEREGSDETIAEPFLLLAATAVVE